MIRLRHAASLLLMLVLASIACASTTAQEIPNEQPSPGDVGAPPEPVESRHIYDYASLLNDAQETAIGMDADRLQRFGIPSLILVQASDMTPEEAASYANELLTAWSVESAPGASDGVVMLIVVDLTDDRNVFTVMAWGERALPHFGIDREVASRIHERWLDAYVQEGYIFEGILFSLRRLVYHSIYDPAPVSDLEGFRAVMHTLVNWLAPILGLAGVAMAVVLWTGRINRFHHRPRELDLAMAWGIPVLAVVVAALAVWAESGMGVVAAMILGVIPVVEWVRREPGSSQSRLRNQVAP